MGVDLLKKIQALAKEKVRMLCKRQQHLIIFLTLHFLLDQIVWPAEWSANGDDTPCFIVTVDGMHCQIQEPHHPMQSKNPVFYSHKSNQAGIMYEIAVSVFQNKLIWIKGPFPASKHDITIFRQKGLKNKIPQGKKAIADRGYCGEPALISTPNFFDPPDLRKFKSRA